MMDTHDTNLPEKAAELEEEKKATEVSEPALTETPAEEATQEEKPVEAIQKLCLLYTSPSPRDRG